MIKYPRPSILCAVLTLFLWSATAAPAQADTGTLRVVFGKAGLIAAVGSGEGILTFHGKRYAFQGEGTQTDPFQSPGNPAHYYKFGEIFHGRKIIKTATGFAYGGDTIPFDRDGVYPMKSNPKIADFASGSQARQRVEEFSTAYSNLLNVLHTAFNGKPAMIDTAIGLMYEIKMIAVSLMQTPTGDGNKTTAGPSFEYIGALSGADA